MQDIAAELDMQKGSLYYYFESKEALLATLVRSRVDAAVEALEAIVNGGGPADTKLVAGIRSHVGLFQEYADVYTIFSSEKLGSIDAEGARLVDKAGRKYEGLWAELLHSGMAAGVFRPDLDVPVVVKAIVGLCNSTLYWFREGGRLDVDGLSERFSSLVLGGIGV